MASPKRASFATFKKTLENLSGMKERQEATHDLFKQLSASDPSDVLAFGQELAESMKDHEKSDSLERAHAEGRAVYRSWNNAGVYDQVDLKKSSLSKEAGDRLGTEAGAPRIGFDALNLTLDPKTFRSHKDAYRNGSSPFGPTIELPTTLIAPGESRPTVFSDMNPTVTALLPEEHYAAFFAFNEVAKNVARGHKEAYDNATRKTRNSLPFKHIESLTQHAKEMRATVTRPALFDSKDIGSWGQAFADPNPDQPPHVRKVNSEHTLGLNTGFDEKMGSRLRTNAVFYQTFYKAEAPKKGPHDWNEMIVKFRATGHTAPLAMGMDMADTVHALEERTSLDIEVHAPKQQSARHDAKTFAPIPAHIKK